MVEASNFQEILTTTTTSKCVTKNNFKTRIQVFLENFNVFLLFRPECLFFTWQVSFCFQRIPYKLIFQRCGLRFSVAITVFKISGFKVFKCYVIFQKSLNLIRLQPKTNQLCRSVPEMNPLLTINSTYCLLILYKSLCYLSILTPWTVQQFWLATFYVMLWMR